MPYKRQYSNEQRTRAFDLYWEDREPASWYRYAQGKNMKGKYTLKQIEQMTGVKAGVAWAIARGLI